MDLKHLIIFSGILVLIACTPKSATVVEQPTTSIPSQEINVKKSNITEGLFLDPDVRRGTLANGLKYYIQHNNKPENRAELRLAVNVGSTQEDEDQLGIAHFVEHMAFNGTENFEKSELVDYLESVGSRFGPDLNAYTSFDETVYMLQVRTDDQDQFTTGIQVLEDWAGGITFDPEEIDKERGVVISEWRTRLSANQRMQQKYFPVIFKNSRYAERLPIGKPEIIETISPERVKQFYTDWYRPDQMALMVVGNVDVDSLEIAIQERFGKLSNPNTPRVREEYEVPIHEGTLVSICTDKEATTSSIQLMYRHPYKKIKEQKDIRDYIVWGIYNGMLNNRLRELTQEADPPFLFAYSGFGGGLGNVSNYTSYAAVEDKGVVRGLQAIIQENERALRFGFNDTELQRVKIEIMRSAERSVKEKDKRESRSLVSGLLGHFTGQYPVLSPDQNLEMYQEYIPGIEIEEINQLAKQWIQNDGRIVVITGPDKEGVVMPDENEVLSILEDIKSVELEPYEDEVIDEPLLSTELVPVEFASEKYHEEIDAHQFTLPNGINIYLKQTDFKNDEIVMSGISDGGHSQYDEKKYKQARYASSITDQSGLKNMELTQLEKLLTGKIVSLSPYISSRSEGFRGYASPDDLEVLFQLMYLYFTESRHDEKALQSFVTKQKSFLKNLEANPNAYFNKEVTKIMYQDHPRVGYPTVEELEALDIDQIAEIYKDRFADASDFTFYFVGNFEMNVMKNYLREYVGNLPTVEREDEWKDIGIDYAPGKIEKTFIKGQAPKTNVRLMWHGPFEWNAKNRYDFNSMIQVLRIKLRESMREDLGGVYGVSLRGSTSKEPKPEYSINLSFNCDPDKTEELINTALNDIMNAKDIGAEEKDMDKVKETQKQSRVKDMEQNRFWLNGMSNCVENEYPFSSMLLPSLEEKIEGLQAEDIKSAAKGYFNMNSMMKFILNPEPSEEN